LSFFENSRNHHFCVTCELFPLLFKGERNTPLQKTDRLTDDVIVKMDVEKVIVDRVEWFIDERRWCFEGNQSKYGW
jgi:hypothetical protein